MPIMCLTIGVPTPVVVGTVYALPTRLCTVTTNGGTYEGSMDGTTFVDVTVPADNNFRSAVPFIRPKTGSNLILCCKSEY